LSGIEVDQQRLGGFTVVADELEQHRATDQIG
jgi:hypothetical protein